MTCSGKREVLQGARHARAQGGMIQGLVASAAGWSRITSHVHLSDAEILEFFSRRMSIRTTREMFPQN
jgi:hypothetical protein